MNTDHPHSDRPEKVGDHSTTAVEIPVPGAVEALHLLDRVDYADAFAIATNTQLTPEQWMRTFLEGAPLWFQIPWKAGLGSGLLGGPLQLRSRHGDVLGFQILADHTDEFVLGADTPRGLDARLIALAQPGQAIIATQIRLNTTYARTLWPVIRPGHRHFVPYLLTRARAATEHAVR